MMKRSHRKDVIIARIIFVIFCLILLAVIVGAILLIKRHFPSGGEKNTQTETSSDATGQQGNTFPVIDSQPDSMPVVEESQPSETEEIVKISMRTTTGVNLRKEPNTSCDVLTILTEGTRVEMIGEEAGWAMVEYQGQTGYVSLDYLEEVTDNAGE